MKLAEALNERAHLSRRLNELRARIIENAKYQEGDAPPENPADLLADFGECSNNFDELVIKINQTNNSIALEDGTPMLKALANRESLKATHSLYRALASEAIPKQGRYSKSEIKFISAVKVSDIQNQADHLAKQLRKLDSNIQQCNWNHDLI